MILDKIGNLDVVVPQSRSIFVTAVATSKAIKQSVMSWTSNDSKKYPTLLMLRVGGGGNGAMYFFTRKQNMSNRRVQGNCAVAPVSPSIRQLCSAAV